MSHGFFRPRLDLGDYLPPGMNALELQNLLGDIGYPVPLTGVYDFETSAAVIDFKRTHGLANNWDIDDPTWEAMVNAAAANVSGKATGYNPKPKIDLDPVPLSNRFKLSSVPWWAWLLGGYAAYRVAKG